jgi:hypothetical protein
MSPTPPPRWTEGKLRRMVLSSVDVRWTPTSAGNGGKRKERIKGKGKERRFRGSDKREIKVREGKGEIVRIVGE